MGADSHELRAADPRQQLVLKNMQGLRRDMLEVVERQARIIDLLNRLSTRVDEFGNRMDKGFRDVQSDMVLMENKVLTAQSDILRVVLRLDEGLDGETSDTRV